MPGVEDNHYDALASLQLNTCKNPLSVFDPSFRGQLNDLPIRAFEPAAFGS